MKKRVFIAIAIMTMATAGVAGTKTVGESTPENTVEKTQYVSDNGSTVTEQRKKEKALKHKENKKLKKKKGGKKKKKSSDHTPTPKPVKEERTGTKNGVVPKA